MLSLYVL
jgi:Ca2+-binding EF-hand superfamily protein